MSIEINFQDTLDKAGRLEELADDMNSICNNEIAQTSGAIATNWEGDGANFYRKALDQTNKKLINKADALKRTAESLGKSARRLKKLEEMAQSIFSLK